MTSFYSDIFKRSIDSLSYKNKITKNKFLNKYEKTNLLKKNNYIFDLNKRTKKQNAFDLNDEFVENSIIKNDLFYKNNFERENLFKTLTDLFYKNNFERENLFKTLTSFYSDISKRSVDSLSFKNKITKNKILNKYEKTNLLKKNNYIFDLNKKIKKQNIFDLNDEFVENSIIKNDLFYKNNFERENLFKTLT